MECQEDSYKALERSGDLRYKEGIWWFASGPIIHIQSHRFFSLDSIQLDKLPSVFIESQARFLISGISPVCIDNLRGEFRPRRTVTSRAVDPKQEGLRLISLYAPLCSYSKGCLFTTCHVAMGLEGPGGQDF